MRAIHVLGGRVSAAAILLIVPYWIAHAIFAVPTSFAWAIAISTFLLSVVLDRLDQALTVPPLGSSTRMAALALIWGAIGWFGRAGASSFDWVLFGVSALLVGFQIVSEAGEAKRATGQPSPSTRPGT